MIAGDGPEMKRLRKRAGKNIEFLGEQMNRSYRNIYAQCRALLFAADEDFGMVPVEAQSYGRPVIAYGKGGSLETVIGAYPPIRQGQTKEMDGITGVFFKEQTPDSLAQAILSFEAGEESFVPHRIQLHARKFDTSVFVDRLRNYIECVMTSGWEPLESKE